MNDKTLIPKSKDNVEKDKVTLATDDMLDKIGFKDKKEWKNTVLEEIDQLEKELLREKKQFRNIVLVFMAIPVFSAILILLDVFN